MIRKIVKELQRVKRRFSKSKTKEAESQKKSSDSKNPTKPTKPDAPEEWPLKRVFDFDIPSDRYAQLLSELSPHETPGFKTPPADSLERFGFVNVEGISPKCEIDGHLLASNEEGYLDVDGCDKMWHFIVEKYKEHVPFKNGVETVIDIGGGNGAFAATVQKLGVFPLVIDMEFYHSLLQVAAVRGIPTMNWNVKAPLPFVANSYDAIHSNDVFFYFNQAAICSILNEWDRVVRPGGYFILTFYQVSGSVEAHEKRVQATLETVKRLQWIKLKEEQGILEADDQRAFYGIYQKPLSQ